MSTSVLELDDSSASSVGQFGVERIESAAAARAANGHVVAAVSYGDGRRVVCLCGESFTGKSDEAMAAAYHGHATKYWRARHEFPVERILP